MVISCYSLAPLAMSSRYSHTLSGALVLSVPSLHLLSGGRGPTSEPLRLPPQPSLISGSLPPLNMCLSCVARAAPVRKQVLPRLWRCAVPVKCASGLVVLQIFFSRLVQLTQAHCAVNRYSLYADSLYSGLPDPSGNGQKLRSNACIGCLILGLWEGTLLQPTCAGRSYPHLVFCSFSRSRARIGCHDGRSAGRAGAGCGYHTGEGAEGPDAEGDRPRAQRPRRCRRRRRRRAAAAAGQGCGHTGITRGAACCAV